MLASRKGFAQVNTTPTIQIVIHTTNLLVTINNRFGYADGFISHCNHHTFVLFDYFIILSTTSG
jgi:hypothetical protein